MGIVTGRRSTGRDHLAVTREAGLGRLSMVSVLAGVTCAYGAFAVVAGIVGSVASAVDAETDFRSDDWTGSGAVASVISAVVLLVAYLFGGYVAGRMARRSAVLHGASVFIASMVVGGVVGGVIGVISDSDDLRQNLRSIGVPTSVDQISDVGIVGLIVSAAAILIGSVVGAIAGERWHTKLARRAADPTIGPAADARRLADREVGLRSERIDHDELVRRDVDAGRGDTVAPPDPDSVSVDSGIGTGATTGVETDRRDDPTRPL